MARKTCRARDSKSRSARLGAWPRHPAGCGIPILVMIACLSGATSAPAFPSDSVTGFVQSVDTGSRLTIDERRIRLWGIDAPDRDQACLDGEGQAQRCGEIARIALDILTRERRVTCRPVAALPAPDPAEAAPMRCTLDGYDLNGRMVMIGYALNRAESAGLYTAAEAQARNRRTGLWGGVFVPPAVWRERKLGR